ncbi:hypothetical protein EG352_07225 [Chryseobacterium indologenes]|uniref:LysM domain-containing protein n=1 Tax=Chryseobacterium indologenes TaxID=253 RepID=A0AAD0YUK1_CHRID|nr:hypothetical protein [Chryseobacterium indologenes]AZB17570.1 hypothetical protein EG352_07225 [Chryseobacterium indologenes]
METITVLHNQSLLDIAIQYTGKVENSFKIAVYNDVSMSDSLPPGATITIPDDVEKDQDVINYFSYHGFQPATDLIDDLIEVKPLSGIGYWEIETTFEVQ